MKIVLFANHLAILPAIDYFNSQGWLHAVLSTDKLHGENLQIEDICKQQHILFHKIEQSQLQTLVPDLIRSIEPDFIFMCGFSYKIPSQVFSIPTLGFYNIHFSLLPAYRGPDPIFWQLKNGETTGGISIHKVDKGFDSGAVVARLEIPFVRGENWGICNSRHGAAVFNLMIPLINKMTQQEEIFPLTPFTVTNNYQGRPGAEDLMIQWDSDTANDIENLVNASNPCYGGALTFYKQTAIRILEVSPAFTTNDVPAAAPGTLVFSDAQNGLVVMCADKSMLRINILKINEGYFSGFKLFAMGVQTGDQFHTHINQQPIIN